MPTTALAPHFLGGGKIELTTHSYRDPGPGELLLRVEADAVCGTDREQYFEGSACVPGHEGVGVVIGVGDDVQTAVGTRGAIFSLDHCGHCRSCLAGHTNQCMAERDDMGFTADGAYGPIEVVHETNFFPVPDKISGVEATLLLDGMGTSGHALGRIGGIREDVESLYVAGAGVGHGEGLALTVSPDLIAPERTVMGSECFRITEMAENLEILLANRELFGRIITHRVPRWEIARAFELFLSGETGKVVVVEDET